MTTSSVGLSGFSVYVPPYRVDLRRWCEWTENSWDKVGSVVGTGFRMLGPTQSVYTMAATSALRLIDRYDVDPQRVRFLGLGTESSTDNSAGAVIIRGMLDDALRTRGVAPLSRNCEVPEIKHACLGGIYALKQALRFLATESDDAVAIVISADVAKYDLGSTGEPTQGAGAVAMLVEKNPRLLEINIGACGSASAYRAVDFRKPLVRSNGSHQFRDTPIFNGKYSTNCYLDEAVQAFQEMLRRLKREPREYFQSVRAVFMHRPYERMPLNALTFSYLFALANDGAAGRAELEQICVDARIPLADVLREMHNSADILELALENDFDRDPYPNSMKLVREFRAHEDYQDLIASKMRLGIAKMRELGNLYSASLPAWMAAGLDEAAGGKASLADQEILAVGYGSGDAAESIPMRAVKGWEHAARKIAFMDALQPVVELDRENYLALHQRRRPSVAFRARDEFVIDRIGTRSSADFSDEGIEYYRYVNGIASAEARVQRPERKTRLASVAAR
jgi:hydroxymethylglutaryl-CoA synthase